MTTQTNRSPVRIVRTEGKPREATVYGVGRSADLRQSPVDALWRLWVWDYSLNCYAVAGVYRDLSDAKAKVADDVAKVPNKREPEPTKEAA